MRTQIATLLLAALVAAPALASEVPDAKSLETMLTSTEDANAFAELYPLKLSLHEEETAIDGSRQVSDRVLYVNPADLSQMRLEMMGNVVLGRSGSAAWATIDDELDPRPSSPAMASGTINEIAFPLLFPHSLALDGVELEAVDAGTWEEQPVWTGTLSFRDKFFGNPVMSTDWEALVEPNDLAVRALQFTPQREYVRAGAEGMRYSVLSTQEVEGCSLPKDVLVVGLGADGAENGHVKVIKVEVEVLESWDPRLFLSPEEIERFEEDSFIEEQFGEQG
jgi:hypothetical protein